MHFAQLQSQHQKSKSVGQMARPRWHALVLCAVVLVGLDYVGRQVVERDAGIGPRFFVTRLIGLKAPWTAPGSAFVESGSFPASPPRFALPDARVRLTAPGVTTVTSEAVRSVPVAFAPRKDASDEIQSFLRKLDQFEAGVKQLRTADDTPSGVDDVGDAIASLRAATKRVAAQPLVLDEARKLVARLLCIRKASVGTLVIAPSAEAARAVDGAAEGAAPRAFLTHALRYMGIAHAANAKAMPHLMFYAVDGGALGGALRIGGSASAAAASAAEPPEPAWLTSLRPRVEVQVVRDVPGVALKGDVQLAVILLSDFLVLSVGAYGWWEAAPSGGGAEHASSAATVVRYPALLSPMSPFWGIPERGDPRARASPKVWDKRDQITIVQAAEGDLVGPTAVSLRTHRAYGEYREKRYAFDPQCVENEDGGIEAPFNYWVKCGLTMRQCVALSLLLRSSLCAHSHAGSRSCGAPCVLLACLPRPYSHAGFPAVPPSLFPSPPYLPGTQSATQCATFTSTPSSTRAIQGTHHAGRKCGCSRGY